MMPIDLSNGDARIVVRPDLGAGLTAFDVLHDGVWQPVFRRVDPFTAHPFALSNILLVPFSGRISGGGFMFDGTFHALPRNIETEPYPIHGNGFSAVWNVASLSADSLTLTLSAEGPGPFRYDARMSYRLQAAGLVMELSLVNRAKIRLPYGAGFHPWFVRDPDTTLHAPAGGVWLEQSDHLPRAYEATAAHPEMDFSSPQPLPARWINNWFDGWGGKARIHWPSRGLVADVDASKPLRQYVVFSPAADADFFCFEPVTHPVDAFNLPGKTEAHGLKILEPDESLAVSTRVAASFG
ncbi:aldose 1-epimerase [Sinorhizobium arboris]|uniref:aldose 1-epimerase n=1 Tax=Sinorhizobium arboris TaxID=76745 RepID=UPI0004014992|nr:aldose 1-epimerase [Sinorhizobium arboris]